MERTRVSTLLVVAALPLAALADGEPPDDTPTFKVGGTIFADYTYVSEPTTTDVDGNTIHAKGFDVRRAYVNVTGNISSLFSYRVTPDVTRQTLKTEGQQEGEKVTLSTDGSLVYRLKFAYGQLNLDRFTTKESWVRFGLVPTPYIEYTDAIYRYRFQGQNFTEREGLLSSADFGLAGRWAFPGSFGDVVLAYLNGDTYTKAESNDQQALMVRASLRPAPHVDALAGLRLAVFYDDDRYARSDPKSRLAANVTFEHKYLNAAVEYIAGKDQTSATAAEVKSGGYSIWVTPRTTFGLEGLLRHDSFQPNRDDGARKDRTILGIAYWFPVKKGVAATVMLDYERLTFDASLGKPDEKRWALHTLFNF